MKVLHWLIATVFIYASCSSTHQAPKSQTSSPPPSNQANQQPAQVEQMPEITVTASPEPYRSAHDKINEIEHTNLNVSLDWDHQYLDGEEWITLHPYFYPTDSLTLDAKGMQLDEVSLVTPKGNSALKYDYDSSLLKIHLDKTYRMNEAYTIYIKYVSMPNKSHARGSSAITQAKGLYFINPDGKNPDEPREVWTEGETESNSNWFPTIDKPNMKTTYEINIVRPDTMVSLSNGLMTASKDNKNGTHTDTWKLDLPFAPYLVAFAVGPYVIVKDHLGSMDVNYYVDKQYAPYARDIFGKTPEMIKYFSDRLRVPFAWPKYDQATAHEFVAGAEENVTCTFHSDAVQQTKREMLDRDFEDYVSHELFHQWFGDLVTTESWSNITLNESFADYGEYLWREHEYGKDDADAHLVDNMGKYMRSQNAMEDPLVRFHYDDREDVFDRISYEKGGCILNMLRNYVGDSAFFSSLNYYLTQNKFQAAEVPQLRMAFQKITGQDLNWFFNQWYYSAGYPKLDIHYHYDDTTKTETVTIDQMQTVSSSVPVFRIPMAVDIYSGNQKIRKQVVADQKNQTLTFDCSQKPDLVNIDADGVLVCEKTDHKTDAEWAFQLRHAPNYRDRWEAVTYFSKDSSSKYGEDALLFAMNDKQWQIRQRAVDAIHWSTIHNKDSLIQKLHDLASADPKSLVRAAAIGQLSGTQDPKLASICSNAISNDSSYAVIENALESLGSVDSVAALKQAAKFQTEKNSNIIAAVAGVYAQYPKPEFESYFQQHLAKDSRTSSQIIAQYSTYLNNSAKRDYDVQNGISTLKKIATDSSVRWFNRYAATRSLSSLQKTMEVQASQMQNDLDQMTVGSTEYLALKDKLSRLVANMYSLKGDVAFIKQHETNTRLKAIYNSPGN